MMLNLTQTHIHSLPLEIILSSKQKSLTHPLESALESCGHGFKQFLLALISRSNPRLHTI